MQRALKLAAHGLGKVSPNPLVGCVIVKAGKIVGEGYHRAYGEAHAEVNAVNNADSASALENATAYVTLEPCSHFGKTPPCTDLLIEKKIGKVFIALTDPNPLVNGQGIGKLNAAGIRTEVGLLAEEARTQNCRFLTFIAQKRPYIILKWAQTADGFLARKNYDSRWISNALSRKLVHKWRTEEDAILIGANTAHYDNPLLTSRDWRGKNPQRIVAEGSRNLSDTLNIFGGTRKAWRYKTTESKAENEICLPKDNYLNALFADLRARKIQSVIVEGGSILLHTLLSANLWDEIRLFVSPKTFGEGIAAPLPRGVLSAQKKILDDSLLIFKNK